MIDPRIRAFWPSADGPLSAQATPFADRCQRFLREVAVLHPWLQHFSYMERRKGKQPVDVIDMPVEKFAIYVRRKQTIFDLCTPTSDDAPTIYVGFIHGSDTGPGICHITGDLAFWNEEPLVRNVLALMINYWQATDANIAAMAENTSTIQWLYWLKWHRDGKPSVSEWQDQNLVGAPSSGEPWCDGMLYTWPEHHPARLIAGDTQGIAPTSARG